MIYAMKKVSITIMVAVFVVAMCLPIVMLPSKAYADTTYAIGDTGPAGGKIFYVSGSSYLEAALSDISTNGIAWITGGSTRTTLNGNTLTAIGTGQANTNAIIAQTGHTGSAAKECADYVSCGYSDWFLPSRDELEQMYINRVAIGGFSTTYYWSSTEDDSGNASSRSFSSGALGSSNKDAAWLVRAIRAFTITTTYVEPVWARTQGMTCKRVWINEDNKFQFSFIYPYRDNNWVKIYDMGGKEVFSINMPYDNPNIIVDLPNGMYTVKTFTAGSTSPIQTFVIGK
jgi:hypothetical protein